MAKLSSIFSNGYDNAHAHANKGLGTRASIPFNDPSSKKGANNYKFKILNQLNMDEGTMHSFLSPERQDCAKKLFEDESLCWRNTSDYFSQSGDDTCLITTLSFSSPPPASPHESWGAHFATPSAPPFHRPSIDTMDSPSFSPPPKQQRLVSPSSLEGSPFKIRSPLSSSPHCTPASRSFGQDTPPRGGASGDDTMHHSPPHIEQLRLFDTPHTPKSIIRRSTMARLPRDSVLQRLKTARVTRSGPELRRRPSKGTNVNPFTPRELCSRAKRKAVASIDSSPTHLTLMEETLTEEARECKKLALKESNISRYKEEFHEVCIIGKGSFGTVYKCINRLDGCYYALKRSHHPVAGSADEPSALREVYAHAVLGSHTHLVRYYSAWAEDNHMLIQNEFCNGGTLFAKIVDNLKEDKVFTQLDLQRLIVHIAKGLQYIHSMQLVHLDIKPENIFITFPESTTPISSECAAAEEQYIPTLPVYKIGDMGHVTSVNDPHVEEGDCRFLPREILSENYNQLPKADIFALGLTAYCAGSNRDLPKNGNEWHNIRDGHLPSLRHCSNMFNALLQAMVCSDPSVRPSASSLVSHPVICPVTEKTKAELYKELNEEKLKNEFLSRQLQEARKGSNGSKPPKILVGGARCNRSMSVGNIF